jgi:hypothetical protein
MSNRYHQKKIYEKIYNPIIMINTKLSPKNFSILWGWIFLLSHSLFFKYTSITRERRRERKSIKKYLKFLYYMFDTNQWRREWERKYKREIDTNQWRREWEKIHWRRDPSPYITCLTPKIDTRYNQT